jgi:hypothetical protein
MKGRRYRPSQSQKQRKSKKNTRLAAIAIVASVDQQVPPYVLPGLAEKTAPRITKAA